MYQQAQEIIRLREKEKLFYPLYSAQVKCKVTLKSLKHGHYVTIHREELPFLGLWSPEKGAPFVCIEPWGGHTDYVTNSVDIREKKDFVKLSIGDTFKCQYEMNFGK